MLCPGLGQLYAGRPARAWLALAFTCLVVVPSAIVLVAASLINSTPTLLRSVLPRGLSLVPTGAMNPTILVGDQIVVDRRAAALASLAIGDVVVFESPGDPAKEYVKRLAGLPGNMVEVRAGRLFVDAEDRTAGSDASASELLSTEQLGSHKYQIRLTPVAALGRCFDWGPERVPENSYFVLGDNRCESRDSRSFGAIPVSHVRGRALRIHTSQDPASKVFRWERFGKSLVQ